MRSTRTVLVNAPPVRLPRPPVSAALGLWNDWIFVRMKLAIEMGNPRTQKWERLGAVDLVPYSGRSSTAAKILPTMPTFVVEYALQHYKLDVHGEATAIIHAFHSESENMVSLMVDYREQRLAQAMGAAFSPVGGLALLVRVPGTTVPINLVCET